MIAKEKAEAIRKAKQYLDTCKDNYTAAMHCDDDTFRKAARALHQAKIRLRILENAHG